MRRTSQDIIAIRQKLIEVKQHLGQVNWSISAINKFMQVGELCCKKLLRTKNSLERKYLQ